MSRADNLSFKQDEGDHTPSRLVLLSRSSLLRAHSTCPHSRFHPSRYRRWELEQYGPGQAWHNPVAKIAPAPSPPCSASEKVPTYPLNPNAYAWPMAVWGLLERKPGLYPHLFFLRTAMPFRSSAPKKKLERVALLYLDRRVGPPVRLEQEGVH